MCDIVSSPVCTARLGAFGVAYVVKMYAIDVVVVGYLVANAYEVLCSTLEPRDKIKERIGRSPDSFVAGTVVLTPDGNVPIETITPGDKVITPKGERTVLRVWKTETSVLTTVKLNNGNVIVGKPSVFLCLYSTLEFGTFLCKSCCTRYQCVC